MKKKWIKREILMINKKIEIDPFTLDLFYKLFDWAYKMGKKGINIKNIRYELSPPQANPSHENFDPLLFPYLKGVFSCLEEINDELINGNKEE